MTTVDYNKILADKGIRAEFSFIPFSKSKNSSESALSLNWNVKLFYKDREIIETPFFQGIGNAPVYKLKDKFGSKLTFNVALKMQCELGKEIKYCPFNRDGYLAQHDNIKSPSVADLFYCLILDADAIDYPAYEDWADTFGLDHDSRKGLALYHECLTTGLRLRAGLGESLLKELRELFSDF
jgi:hypothetical protein